MVFRTKPEIALALVDRARANGVRVRAWTCDELYGRSSAFLDGLDQRGQVFVAEVPTNFHGWMTKPRVLRKGPTRPRRGRPKTYPRLAAKASSCEVGNLLRYSPVFRRQAWRRYRVKDTTRGPEVWEVKWAAFGRKADDGLPSRRQCLMVIRNVVTGDVKYFVSNRVPGDPGISLRFLLRVAVSRWSVEKNQADYPSSGRWVGTRRIGYHRRDGVARADRVVPAAPRGTHRRNRMSDPARRSVPPRA
ncbi:Mobile element protein [Fimbriiglobus ruber]|uniref:Mobile element protein n=1 Tax=Fimbriiglobus ruber TaxID=1908690 RepID=A0A225DB65_9BACT|nr:Mobile element protein [Fimbriiglobus ruber]